MILLEVVVQTSSVKGQKTQSKINYDAGIALAHELAIDGNYEVSRLLCQRILQDVPEYFDAYFIIGNTYAWEKRPDEARLFYYKVFEYDNGNIDAFNQLITMELWEGDAAGALDMANMALKHHPDNPDVLLKKARALIMLGDFHNAKKSLFVILSRDSYKYSTTEFTALELYRDLIYGVTKEVTIEDQTVLSLMPVDTIFKKAQNFAWNQEFVYAKESLELILNAQPDYLPAYVLLAQVYAWQNNFTKAREIIRSEYLVNITYRDGIFTAIDIELWDEEYDKAIEIIDSLGLKQFPRDREFLFKKADVLKTQGEIFKAKDIIYQLLKTNPSDYQAMQYYNELKNLSFKDRIGSWSVIQASSKERGMDGEAWLKKARELSHEKRYDEAQAICMRVLEIFPDDYEAQFIIGITMAWMGRFDEAREWYDKLMTTTFDSHELIGAIVDLEIWDENYAGALEQVKYGLKIFPNDKEYLKKLVTIYQVSGQVDLANRTLDQLISVYPNDKEIRKSYYNLKGLMRLNAVSADYIFDTYSLPAKRTWQMYSARYFRSNDIGTFVGSVNTGYISSDTSAFSIRGGYQFELDAYPIFPSKKRYFHINYGFSPSSVFARHRFGTHIYQDLMPGWELSAGFNYSHYRSITDTTNVLILQAGISKYWSGFMGNFVITLAPTPLKLSQGYTLIGRKYFDRPDNWVQLAIGTGVYPENPVFYLNDISITPVGLLNSFTIYAGSQHVFKDQWIGRVFVGYQRQEYMASFLRNSWTFSLAAIYLLKGID